MTPDAGAVVVLLVEDDPAYPHLLRAQLQDAWPQARLEHAPDLTRAVQRLAGERFDCVLLDLGLPDGRGPGNVTRVRDAAPAVPIVVLTGHDDEELALRSAVGGAASHLRKHDVTVQELVAAVRLAILRGRDERLGPRSEGPRTPRPPRGA